MQFSYIVYIKITFLSIVFTKKNQNSLDRIDLLLYNKVITQIGVKTMKKLIAILLALVLTLSLFACKKDDGKDKGDNKEPTTEEPVTGEEDVGPTIPGEEDGKEDIDKEQVKNPASPEAYGLGDYLTSVTVDGIVYQIFANGAVVYDYVGNAKSAIEVPKTVEYTVDDSKKTADVKVIGEAAFYSVTASEIKLPEGITSIEINAFRNCENLAEFAFPKTVKKVGDKAFAFSGLKSVNIESEITYGEYVYYACQSLASATVDGGIKNLSKGIFACCKSLTSAKLADSLTEIAEEAFFCCYKLTNVTIPSGVTAIGNKAFYCCKAFTSIVVPANVKTLGEQSFYNCVKAEAVALGGSLETIEAFALYGCKSLKSIAIPESVDTLGDGAFGELTLTEITIPAGITVIPAMLFINSENLRTVNIVGDVTEVLDRAFSGTYIESLVVKASVETFGTYVFENCKNLKLVTFECDIKTLPAGTFAGCESITSIQLPVNLKAINDYAFDGCEAISELDFPSSIETLGKSVFNNCTNISEIDLTKTAVATVGEFAFSGCTKIKNMTIPAGMTVIPASLFSGCSSLESVDILGDLVEISAKAFMGCEKLKTVAIPDSLTTIGLEAFRNCLSLNSIELGDGIRTIKRSAFYNCPELKELYIGPRVTEIGGYAFGFIETPGNMDEKDPQPLVNKDFVATGYYGAPCKFEMFVGSFTDVNGDKIAHKTLGRLGDSAFEDFTYEIIGKITFTEKVVDEKTKEEEIIVTERDAVRITGYKGNDINIVVPVSFRLDDLYVTEIADGVFKGKDAKTIKVPSWITTIGDDAFADCSSLIAVEFAATGYTLPEDAEKDEIAGPLTLGENLFSGAPDYFVVVGPKGSYIESAAKTNSWAFANTVPEFVYEVVGKDTFTVVTTSATGTQTSKEMECETVKIVDYTITGTEVAIPEYYKVGDKYYFVVEIAGGLFKGNTEIESITLPKYIKTIGNEAFADCTALKKAEFKETGYTDDTLTLGTDIFRGVADDFVVIGAEGFYIESAATTNGWKFEGVPSSKTEDAE